MRDENSEDKNSQDPVLKICQLHVDYCDRNGTFGCTMKQAQICKKDYSALDSVLVRVSSKEKRVGPEWNDLDRGMKFLSFPTMKSASTNETETIENQKETSFQWFGFSPKPKQEKKSISDMEREKIIVKNGADYLARHWKMQSAASSVNHLNDDAMGRDAPGSEGWSSWMYSKSTNLVVSLLAKLDLADEPNDVPSQKRDRQIFHDDCFDHQDDQNDIDYAQDDCFANKSVQNDVLLGVDNDLFIYNIDLIISCCQLLTTHVVAEIASSYLHEYEERGQIINFKTENGTQTSSGLLLHRYRHSLPKNESTSSCLSFAQYAQCVGNKYANDTSGNILQRLPQLHQNQLDLLARVLVAARHAIWTGDDDSMIVIFLNQQKEGIAAQVKLGESYHVALFQLYDAKYSLESRLENVLIPKADELKRRAIHEKTVKKNTSRAILYMKRYKVLETEIDRSMKIICNLEQQVASLSTARNNVQIMESYATIKDAMSALRLNQDEVETVMEEVQELNLETESTHKALVNDVDSHVDNEELENELFSLMQEKTLDEKKNPTPTDTCLQQETDKFDIDEDILTSIKDTTNEPNQISTVIQGTGSEKSTMKKTKPIMS